MGHTIRIINITHFLPREPPPFPLDEEVIELTKRMRLSGSAVEDDDTQAGSTTDDGTRASQDPRLLSLIDSVKGWDVSTGVASNKFRELPAITVCEIAFGGGAVLGAGDKGTLFIWRLASR